MRLRSKQSGLTLTEMTVVVASIALLAVFGLPAVRAFVHSFETESSTKSMIGAALSSARAMAAQKQRYVGIRFQKAYNRNAADPLAPLTAPQYMIFIIHDPAATGLADGFRAIEGLKPVKLPDSVGVMDLTINADPQIDTPEGLRNTTTFSVIFSPSGKLIVHEVQVRNRNGKKDNSSPQSMDDIFNTEKQITNPTTPCGMFYQDDYPVMGLDQEYSRNSFIIYDTKEFTQAYKRIRAWNDYLNQVKLIYINPYTGTIISQ